ncbi:MAG: hypothetical protein IJW73_03150 [Candidatus Gastranaerophilales bacterium]|nr:hypothetical protein [Candidatus Gastranaerophilales bacterium]
MEKILEIYLMIVNAIAFISLVGFVILISQKISKRNPLKVMGWIFLILTIIGMYLFIPARLFVVGMVKQNISYIENSIKLSIIPIEKQLYRYKLIDAYISNKNYEKAQKVLKQIDESMYKIKKLDLYLFELQNEYNVKMKEYNKEIEKLRMKN